MRNLIVFVCIKYDLDANVYSQIKLNNFITQS